MKAQSGWLMEGMRLKVEWKFILTANGAQFVMTFGGSWMLMLCVISLDFLVLLVHQHLQHLVGVVDQSGLIMYGVGEMRAHLLIVQLTQLALTIVVIMKMLVLDATHVLQVTTKMCDIANYYFRAYVT